MLGIALFGIAIICGLLGQFALFGIIYILIKYWATFKSQWFAVYLIDCFINYLTWWNTFYTYRLLSIADPNGFIVGLYANSDWVPLRFFQCCSFLFAYYQYSTTCLLAGIRYVTLFSFTVKTSTQVFCLIWLVVTFVLPILDVYRYFVHPPTIVCNENTCSIASSMTTEEMFSWLLGFTLLTTALAAILNVLNWKRFNDKKEALSNNRHNMGKRILYVSFVTTVVQMCGIGIIIAQRFEMGVSPYILPFISDGLSMFQSVFIVMFSDELRQKIKKTLPRCFKSQKVAPVDIVLF